MPIDPSSNPPNPDPPAHLPRGSAAAPPKADGSSPPPLTDGPTATSPGLHLPDTRRIELPLPAVGTFPGFQILREISRGGQGVVYQALQTGTKRKVAIKVLRDGLFASESALRRFQREIELVAQLDHPNIISIFHADQTTDGRKFYAMDYIRGRPLTTYIRERRLALPAILDLLQKICDAMQYAHQRGVIHRDLKPNNILVDDTGEPKILDFGLAKVQFDPAVTHASLSNELLGTLPYMSPEQVRGSPDRIDPATDVYSLGVLLYQCLVGKFPYPVDGDPHEIMSNILHAEPMRPSRARPDLNDELDTIISECLAKDPHRRYPSAGALADDLRRYQSGAPILAKRDSIAYVLRKRTRSAVQRHQITALAAVALVAVLVSIYPIEPLIARWTSIKSLFERAVASLAQSTEPTNDLANVRIIAMRDDTPFSDLAQRENIPNFHLNDNFPLRALHGRLMQRLARALPRVVAWDIKFEAPSPYDAEFVEGASRLHDQNINVVAAVPAWWADDLGKPRLSPKIARAVRWGSVLLGDERIPWQLQLVLQRGVRDPLPSLTLAAAAASRHPRAEYSYLLDPAQNRVLIRYQQPSPDAAKPWIADPDSIQLGEIIPVEPGSKEAAAPGLQIGDRIGLHLFNMPPEDVLDRATIEYAAVFSAPDAQLSIWFNDRAILVADLRTGVDRHEYGTDRSIPGVYAHAVVLDQLLHELNTPADRPAPLTLSIVADRIPCALIGIAIACLARRRKVLLTLLAAALLIGISAGLAIESRYLWNPLAAIIALVLAVLLAGIVQKRSTASPLTQT